MGKWTDKLYITHSEWADNTNSFGGVSTQTTVGAQKRKIGWGRCMCGFTELGEDVVATRGGEVYDVRYALCLFEKGEGSGREMGGEWEEERMRGWKMRENQWIERN